MNPATVVSAQVVLPAHSGARPGPLTRITTENLRDWTPAVETIEIVSGAFRGMGFEIGECVGNSFSITGAVRLFESCFRTKLREMGRRVQFGDHGYELPPEKIPHELRVRVVTITFTPPPDFGPGATAPMA